MDDKLASFDAMYGSTVTNALEQFARHMRETADEIRNPQPDLVREGLRLLAKTVDELGTPELTVLGERMVIDGLIEAARSLVTAARTARLLPEPVPEGVQTISVQPTERGFAGMMQIFADQADRANAAARAYEELTAEPEPVEAEIGSTFNCKIMQDGLGFYAKCTECPYVSRHAPDVGTAHGWAEAHDADLDDDGQED